MSAIRIAMAVLVAVMLLGTAGVSGETARAHREVTLSLGNLSAKVAGTYRVQLAVRPLNGDWIAAEPEEIQAGSGASIFATQTFDLPSEEFDWSATVSYQSTELMALAGTSMTPKSKDPYTKQDFEGRTHMSIADPNLMLVSFSVKQFRATGYFEAPLKVGRGEDEYTLTVWVDGNDDNTVQASEQVTATGTPSSGVLSIASNPVTSWIEETRFTMQMSDPDGVVLARTDGVWDFEEQFPRDLDPWFDRAVVGEIGTWFVTHEKKRLYELENPFNEKVTEIPVEVEQDGMMVVVKPRNSGSDASRPTNTTELGTVRISLVHSHRQVPVEEALVRASQPGAVPIEGRSGIKGEVEFHLVPGNYRFDVEADGFKPVAREVAVFSGEMVARQLELTLAKPTMKDQVDARVAGLDPTIFVGAIVPAAVALVTLAVFLPRIRKRFGR